MCNCGEHSGGPLFGVTHASVSNCGNLVVSLGRLGAPLPPTLPVILSRCVAVLQLQEKLIEQKYTEGVPSSEGPNILKGGESQTHVLAPTLSADSSLPCLLPSILPPFLVIFLLPLFLQFFPSSFLPSPTLTPSFFFSFFSPSYFPAFSFLGVWDGEP